VLALVGIGGTGKTAIADWLVRSLPDLTEAEPHLQQDSTLLLPRIGLLCHKKSGEGIQGVACGALVSSGGTPCTGHATAQRGAAHARKGFALMPAKLLRGHLGKGNMMSLEDKLAIQEVIAQYSYTYDAQDAEGFAALFTEDAVWELFASGATRPEIRLESRAAIRAWAAQRLHERLGRFTSRHYQSGLLFDTLTSDAARTRTMVLVTHQGVTEAAPRPTDSGVYHDQWRKTSEGWRLAHRILRRDKSAPLVST